MAAMPGCRVRPDLEHHTPNEIDALRQFVNLHGLQNRVDVYFSCKVFQFCEKFGNVEVPLAQSNATVLVYNLPTVFRAKGDDENDQYCRQRRESNDRQGHQSEVEESQ